MKRKLEPFSEEVASKVASMLGADSACYRALAELIVRRDRGEAVSLYKCGDNVIVGPSEPQDADK